MNEVLQDYVVAGLIMSIMFNLFLIGWFGFTGIGKEAWKRFFHKRKYRKGGYVNTLMLTKEGRIAEIFKKIVDSKFKVDDKSYVRNPRMTWDYKGIPTHLHKEDEPTPINPWSTEAPDELLSCGELDIVMNSQANFDFKEWIQKITPFLFVVVAVLIIGLIAVIFFSYSNFSLLKDAGVQAASVVIPAVGG